MKLRRRAWQEREVVLEPDGWKRFADRRDSAQETLERSELLDALGDAIDEALTPHQRQVFVALALNEVPIDVLAERLDTTRGALYKSLHDARRKLRGRSRPRHIDGPRPAGGPDMSTPIHSATALDPLLGPSGPR